MAQWRLLRCRAMLAQARGRYADAYRLGAEALGTIAATGFPPAFMMWGGLLSVQCHHTGQTTESLGTAGITDADATLQDWPLTGVIPDPGTGEHAGRCRPAAGGRRRVPPARPGLGVAGIAARHALHLGDRSCDRPGGRGGRRRRGLCARSSAPGAGTTSSTAATRWRTAGRSSSISVGRPHTSGSSTMRSLIWSKR